jgi:hypothetical protein
MTPLSLLFATNLSLLALDHITTGFLGIFFPNFALRFYKGLFGAEIPDTREYKMILKPWGALGVFAGIIGILPIIDPVRYQGILVSLIVLLGMRVWIRAKHFDDGETFLRISRKRNMLHIGLITLCALLIGWEIAVI